MTRDAATRPLPLRTDDGVELAADVRVPEGARAGAVVCHPHPGYGGDRHNHVVATLFAALADAGVAALRFDFRSGAAEGRASRDVAAALDAAAGALPAGAPLWLVGYSFGADVALAVDDPRVAGWVAVAPPLRFGDRPRPGAGDGRPVLAVVAAHDSVAPPDRVRAVVADWPDVTVVEVPMADHFLAGATDRVAELVVAWLLDRA